MKDWKSYLIHPENTIKDALKQLDVTGNKTLFVVQIDTNKLMGSLSDGDIRRALLRNLSLSDKVSSCYFKKPIKIKIENNDVNKDELKEIFLREKVSIIPVVDKDEHIIDLILWSQIFSSDQKLHFSEKPISLPLVIMAGGKGTRMKPFTNIFPKPLLPVGESTLIDLIVERFREQGAQDFHFILNYKASMVESYLSESDSRSCFNYYRESEFLGTAAGLILLNKAKMGKSFILSNCDILVDANYSEVVDFHNKENADLTIVSAFNHFQVPYGVVKYKDNGEVIKIEEKPEFSFTINTGIYILNTECINLIPTAKTYHMTDLIQDLLNQKRKVITYFVNQNQYLDFGEMGHYQKSLKNII
jgi:dTDP-glucose pyrophosphorylase